MFLEMAERNVCRFLRMTFRNDLKNWLYCSMALRISNVFTSTYLRVFFLTLSYNRKTAVATAWCKGIA